MNLGSEPRVGMKSTPMGLVPSDVWLSLFVATWTFVAKNTLSADVKY